MSFRLLATITFLFLFYNNVAAQPVDEDMLFSDSSSLTDSASIVKSTPGSPNAESTSVDFSGGITSVAEINSTTDWFDNFDRHQLTPGAYIIGNLLLDVRLPFDIKAFGNTEVRYTPDLGASFGLRELFVDANIGRRVYIRTGKQVLQWGRCYFWNPTDLINVERKQFIQKVGYREGTYGIRVHVPFGTRWNVYSFIDMNNLKSVDSLAAVAKVEVLLGGTEIGVAIWGKPKLDPIYALDISTAIGDFNIAGELSLTKGTNYRVVDKSKVMDFIVDPTKNPYGTIGDTLIPRLCLGVSRYFDLLEVKDRVSVDAEFYWNQAGDKSKKVPTGVSLLSNGGSMPVGTDPTLVTQMQNLLLSVYEPNSYSRYYASFFTSVNKFIMSELTLSFNGIVNCNQGCAVLSTGLTYATLHNFSLGLSVNAFVGPENTEYTFTKNAWSARATAGVTF